MGNLFVKLGLFLLPILVGLTAAETYLRQNNAFHNKAQYFKQHQNEFEVMFLGSSHTYRAINPEEMKVSALNMANGGSALNLDYKMAKHFIPKLPNLKVLFLELSYQSLERSQGEDYLKNNLYKIYFDVDNYSHGMPLRDHMLLLSNPREYLRILWVELRYPKKLNASGFLEEDSGKIKSRFSYYHYDPEQIYKTRARYLRGRHNEISPELVAEHVKMIKDLERDCEARGIQLILMSPPKYFLYNDAAIPEKLARRDSVATAFERDGIPFWNYERALEKETDYFANEDHLNPEGATVFTSLIQDRLSALPAFQPPQQ